TKTRSKLLGRTLDLSFLPPGERDLPWEAADAAAGELFKRQAARRGLSLDEWLFLVKSAHGKNETVYPGDLEKERAAYVLLSPHLPGVAVGLRSGADTPEGIWNSALKSAAGFKAGERAFWERLFHSVREEYPLSENEAAVSVVLRLERKNGLSRNRVEFAGVLSPMRDLEEMSHDRAREVLAAHMLEVWGKEAKTSLPKEEDLLWLASDLYNASRIFKVPLTFLTGVAHHAFETLGVWPNTLDVYSGTLELGRLIARHSRFWGNGSRDICDLDELSQTLPLTKKNPGALRRKREALIRSVRDDAGPGLLFV
ncbi:MAG: hypothetical protein LBF41_05405, partial [Deltaproteobacteria bacterium]|nr:hypothetical protein [Deltaproteobacteria bacterium]